MNVPSMEDIAKEIDDKYPFSEGQCACGDGYNCLEGVDENRDERIQAIAHALQELRKATIAECDEAAKKLEKKEMTYPLTGHDSDWLYSGNVSTAIRKLEESK